jgi:ABC-type multidrug transport system fused ATPase/permease subunit
LDTPSLIRLLCRLWFHISRRRRFQLFLLLILILVASIAEVVSLGAVVPFLGVLTDPDRAFGLKPLQPLIQRLGLTESKQLLAPVCLVFAGAAIVSNAIRLVLTWVQTQLGYGLGADFSIRIYQSALYQPYSVHITRNSSAIIAAISSKTHLVVYQILLPILTLISSVFILLSILFGILWLDPFLAIVSFGSFGVIYGVILACTRKQLARNSALISKESSEVLKSLNEGLGGIRDILIDGTQEVYSQIYRDADSRQRRAMASNYILGAAPRYFVEGLGICILVSLAFYLVTRQAEMTSATPLLGALAVTAQRMLPTLQLSYSSLVQMNGGQVILKDIAALLDEPLPTFAGRATPSPIPFNKSITLQAISFRYSVDLPWVLKDIQLEIPKGSRVGLIGTTGSGKSTLIDVCMSLIEPEKGALLVDDMTITSENYRSWQVHLAHVPQMIFLADTSVAENIAFGVPIQDIDMERVRESARKACLAEMIESLPLKYATIVGERGVRLSGGQRQRIGIARAMYKQADVIIFDEATSALDDGTEKDVMQAIESLGDHLTIFMVAHRVTTLEKCTLIVEIVDGAINRTGSYQQIIQHQTIS